MAFKRPKRYICTSNWNPVIGSTIRNKALKAYFEKFGQMADTYREAELKKTSGYWYVEYQYRYPEDIRPPGKQFKRYRVVEDLNRIRKKKGEQAAEAYAEVLIKSINYGLKTGVIKHFEKVEPQKETEEAFTLNSAIEYFIAIKKREGLKSGSITDYNSFFNSFKEWAGDQGKLSEPITSISESDMDKYLSGMQSGRKWSNQTFNNHRGFLSGFFELLVQKKKATDNPVKNIAAQKVRNKVHKYYDPDLKGTVKTWMAENDPYLLDFCQFVYYSCMRPKAEVRVIQIGDISLERRLIRVNGKTDDRYVPICHELFEYLKGLNLKQYPSDYYLFSHNGPGAKRVGNGFFSLRYQAMKDTLNIPYEYTIYSWKHTRVIDLIMSGMSAVDAMQITGHTDFTSFQKYLRDLGAAMSGKVIGETVKF